MYILKFLAHYTLLLTCYGLGALYALGLNHKLFNPNLENTYDQSTWKYIVLTIIKTLWLFPFFYLIANTLGHLRYPPIAPPRLKSYTEQLDSKLMTSRIFFRYVTRGKNRTLSARNVAKLYNTIASAHPFTLPDNRWTIEVVTDTDLKLKLKQPYQRKFTQILVPQTYQTPKGTKFKGRALHYSLTQSKAKPNDWIFHLDEETEPTQESIEQIVLFIAKYNHKPYPPIGQGIITYGQHTNLQGWQNVITTLADSLRVSDDYGKFRLQYEQHTTYFGIKGSFILVNNRTANLIGFDHGPKASITEDAYFALKAKMHKIKFGFIHATVKERSPFTIADFIRQRRRWFGGLWLLVRDSTIPLKQKFPLTVMMITWGLSPFSLIPIFTSIFEPTVSPLVLSIIFGIFFGTYVWTYFFGFFHNFKLTLFNITILLPLQICLIPVFSLLEIAGVLYAIVSPPRDFHIVKKKVAPINNQKTRQVSPNTTVTVYTNLSIETSTPNANTIIYVSPQENKISPN